MPAVVALLGCGGGSMSEGSRGNFDVEPVRVAESHKIDLLFMIDSSISMAEKQRLLADAIPVLMNRLISPMCMDENAMPTGFSVPCPAGSNPEFKPVEDIHVGVITSSLGDHGSADVCSDASVVPGSDTTYNDKAQLVPTVNATIPSRAGLASWNNFGFLVWDPRLAGHNPPGYGSPNGSPGDATDFTAVLVDHVAAAGEGGCGYEAQLESWYRFLVDPEPVDYMTNNGQVSVRGPVNQTVLAQRREFLRADSLLAILMLTDENDCSIVDEDGTQGWLVGYKGGLNANSWRMPRSHAICWTSPNDPGCGPCVTGDADPGCSQGIPYEAADDPPSLRCYRQKQRFGIDLLYPTSRCIEALTQEQIDPRFSRDLVPNPIFAWGLGGVPPRGRADVFLAGIVGVPFQDIATADTLNDPRALRYMTAFQLADSGRWDVILGNPEEAVEPTDPFMIESIDPRVAGAANPVIPDAVITASSATELNPINGREQAVIPEERADLQFACIFELGTPVPCNAANQETCDCNAGEYEKNSPLCSYPGAGEDGTQERAKAYPSLRPLEVLKGIGSNAVVASVCPKNVTALGSPATDPDYGYNPAVGALVDRMKEALGQRCFGQALSPETDPGSASFGKVPCIVVEITPPADECPCDPATGRRRVANSAALAASRDYLRSGEYCDTAISGNVCSDYCACEIMQLSGSDLADCQTQPALTGPPGYCYLDEAFGANPALLAGCPPDQRHLLRFVGEEIPRPDSLTVIACPSGT
jgi:hypothetical protein